MRRLSSLLFLSALLFTLAPCPAQEEDMTTDTEEEATPTPEEIKAAKKEAAALKKAKADAAKRAKMKFKVYRNLKKAKADAKKYHLVLWVVYSTPSTCPYCAKLEGIINSKPLKKLKGAAICYIQDSPMPEYGCTARPSGAVLDPDGNKLGILAFHPGVDEEGYAKKLAEYAAPFEPKFEEKAEGEK